MRNSIPPQRHCLPSGIEQPMGLGMHKIFHADAILDRQSAGHEYRTNAGLHRRIRSAWPACRNEPYMFLSSRFKNIAACVSAALLFCILPVIVYMALPEEIATRIYSILPASAVSMQTSILYAAADFDFWNIGPLAIWLPHAMLGAYVVEIPLFAGLTLHSYITHRTA